MKDAIFKWISLILLLTVINEAALIPLAEKNGLTRNVIFYNAFSLADMTIWFLVFFKVHAKRPYRIFIVVAYTVCMLYTMAELFFLKGWYQLHTNSFRVFNIWVIVSAIFYFYEKLKEPYHNLLTDPIFWIASACFLYHSLFFVNLTTLSYPEYWESQNAGRFYDILQDMASTFYYFLLSCSFLICYFSYSRRTQT